MPWRGRASAGPPSRSAPALTARLAALWRRSCGVIDVNDWSDFWHAFMTGSNTRARQLELRSTPPRRSVNTSSSRPLPIISLASSSASVAGNGNERRFHVFGVLRTRPPDSVTDATRSPGGATCRSRTPAAPPSHPTAGRCRRGTARPPDCAQLRRLAPSPAHDSGSRGRRACAWAAARPRTDYTGNVGLPPQRRESGAAARKRLNRRSADLIGAHLGHPRPHRRRLHIDDRDVTPARFDPATPGRFYGLRRSSLRCGLAPSTTTHIPRPRSPARLRRDG
jgi:hypothetical protein